MTSAKDAFRIMRKIVNNQPKFLDGHETAQLARLFDNDAEKAREEWQLWASHFVGIADAFGGYKSSIEREELLEIWRKRK